MVRRVAITRRAFLFCFLLGSFRCLIKMEFRECAALLLPPRRISHNNKTERRCTAMKSRKAMVKPWLTIKVDDLNLFVRMAIALYREHDENRFLWKGTEDPERGRRWIFRGQRKEQWDIASTLERCHHPGYASSIKRKRLEQMLVKDFMREASCQMSFNGLKPLDILALMQHYGAPTRLVDFSESPFLALYFGIADREQRDDFSVWAVCIDALKEYSPLPDVVDARNTNTALFCQQESKDLRDRFERNFWETKETKGEPNVFFAYPRHGNVRLSVQSGLFLAQCALGHRFMDDLKASLGCSDIKAASTKLSKIYAMDRVFDVCACSNLVKFVFPCKMGDECISLLRAMNISPKMLYPGLEGIGKSLSQYLPLIDE